LGAGFVKNWAEQPPACVHEAVRDANTLPAPGQEPRERDSSLLARGELRFADAADRRSSAASLAGAGLIVVALEGLDGTARGRLGDIVDEAIERALGPHAAGSASLSVLGASSFGSYRDATLSDQLFRARRAGARGIAVLLGPLRPLATHAALDPEDTATLAFFAQATRDRPVVLLLDAGDEALPAHAKPSPLSEILAPSPIPVTLAPPAPAPPPARISAPVPRVDSYRHHVQQLTSARGPQPLAAMEKLFTDHYVPLQSLLASGLDDPRAREVHDGFSASFSRSYAEAFGTFAATGSVASRGPSPAGLADRRGPPPAGKRPRMVFDAHDVAARVARLHGARMVRLLLVDAMRWDVALAVRERLPALLSGASLTDDLLLWSSLPTTTSRQLETIARGLEALRAPSSLEPEPEPPRGRNAALIRRMRVGPREVHKLDLVESRIRDARGEAAAELPAIASEVAEVIARHAQSLAPRTLLFVFGDHGFTIDRKGFAAQGGASPEEVLVGAFALLVGEVH
jgi:hypothetical protein